MFYFLFAWSQEYDAARPSVQTSFEGLGKCKCTDSTVYARCSFCEKCFEKLCISRFERPVCISGSHFHFRSLCNINHHKMLIYGQSFIVVGRHVNTLRTVLRILSKTMFKQHVNSMILTLHLLGLTMASNSCIFMQDLHFYMFICII